MPFLRSPLFHIPLNTWCQTNIYPHHWISSSLFLTAYPQNISDFRISDQCIHTNTYLHKSNTYVKNSRPKIIFDHVSNDINSWEMDIVVRRRKKHKRKKRMCHRAAKGRILWWPFLKRRQAVASSDLATFSYAKRNVLFAAFHFLISFLYHIWWYLLYDYEYEYVCHCLHLLAVYHIWFTNWFQWHQSQI